MLEVSLEVQHHSSKIKTSQYAFLSNLEDFGSILVWEVQESDDNNSALPTAVVLQKCLLTFLSR